MWILRATIGFLLAVVPKGSEAQAPDDSTAVELVAAKAAVARQGAGNKRVGVAPDVARTRTAPAQGSGPVRSPARHKLLIEALAAQSVNREEAVRCAGRACSMTGVDVLLTMSDPSFRGDSASITVTIESGTSGRMSYETIELLLVRVRGHWTVRAVTQIGIS